MKINIQKALDAVKGDPVPLVNAVVAIAPILQKNPSIVSDAIAAAEGGDIVGFLTSHVELELAIVEAVGPAAVPEILAAIEPS